MASLTFEAIVLSELETSGSKHVSDIVSESVSQSFTILYRPPPAPSGKLDCLPAYQISLHPLILLDYIVDFYKEQYPDRLKVFLTLCPELTDTNEGTDQPSKKKPNCCR